MRIMVVGVALAVAGCGASVVDQAQEIAAHDLIDPAAAQFRDVQAVNDRCVAGELNAKNRMGAYTGFRHFIVDLNKRQVAIAPDAPTDGDLDSKLAVVRVGVFQKDCGMK